MSEGPKEVEYYPEVVEILAMADRLQQGLHNIVFEINHTYEGRVTPESLRMKFLIESLIGRAIFTVKSEIMRVLRNDSLGENDVRILFGLYNKVGDCEMFSPGEHGLH